MADCPYCNTEIVEELYFCVECEKQVKCLECDFLLYKNKEKCLKCGEPLKQVEQPQGKMNTYIFERETTETTSSERIEMRGTDAAVMALTSRLPLAPNSSPSHLAKQENVRSITPTVTTSTSLPALQEGIIEEGTADQFEDDQESQKGLAASHQRLFNDHAEHGVVPSKILRDYLKTISTKKEKQQVFAIMYTWAHNRQFRENVAKEKLVSAMKHAGLYDENSPRHLRAVIDDYFRNNNDYYEVNEYSGEDRVAEIIEDIENPNQRESKQEQKAGGKRGKRGGISKADQAKIASWPQVPSEVTNGFDVRSLNSAVNWAAFGLYLVTKKIEAEEAVKTATLYAFLKQRYPTMPFQKHNFTERVRTSNKFLKSADGKYSLTESTEAEMRSLLEGSVT